jgi:uncharacterized membrane protein
MMKKIRHLFLSGLFSILPIAATLYIMYYMFRFFDGMTGNLVRDLIGRPIPGAGIVVSFTLILFTGFLVTNVLGVRLFHYGERVLQRMPVAPKIYFGVKQLVDSFSMQGKQAFSRVALLEYPRKGLFVVGFVTGEVRGEVQAKTSERLISVFIPTTPNPTSGMLVLVPDHALTYLDMSVEEGLKLIVSAGIVSPGDPETRDLI